MAAKLLCFCCRVQGGAQQDIENYHSAQGPGCQSSTLWTKQTDAIKRLRLDAQAMLYATEGIDSEEDLQKAMVGVASVWSVISFPTCFHLSRLTWILSLQVRRQSVRSMTHFLRLSIYPKLTHFPPFTSSRCNAHVLALGQRIKKSVADAGLVGYQFGVPGVSDGISMGTFGMSFSLQSRDLIADAVETTAGGHWLDGMVCIPVSARTKDDAESRSSLTLPNVARRATRTCTPSHRFALG